MEKMFNDGKNIIRITLMTLQIGVVSWRGWYEI